MVRKCKSKSKSKQRLSLKPFALHVKLERDAKEINRPSNFHMEKTIENISIRIINKVFEASATTMRTSKMIAKPKRLPNSNFNLISEILSPTLLLLYHPARTLCSSGDTFPLRQETNHIRKTLNYQEPFQLKYLPASSLGQAPS